MDYINSQNLSVEESAVGFDLNDDDFAAISTSDKVETFVEGRYAKISSSDSDNAASGGLIYKIFYQRS